MKTFKQLLFKLNPFRKDYNKMVNQICLEVAENKLEKIFFNLSQEERDCLLLEVQKEQLLIK